MSQNKAVRNKHPRKKLYSTECLTISARQSMQYTGLGERRTYQLLRLGVMPSIPGCGKGYRIPKNALLRWLESCGQQEGERPEPSSPA
jgi:excisionase family DNA binding protein